ncbi:MAG: tripartite tricarboxylate transporter substrate binding protein [Burkholderiales bacterium]|nr:tripartite tricarboxylate transporter substrate binding protein [Burkholderiales bacterium]
MYARYSILAMVAAAGALAVPALAQHWPARPIRIIVPFAPGGGVDTVTRLLAQKMGDALGAQIVTENRAGGGGMIGAELVAKAAPDGYTLLTSAPEFSVNPALRAKLPYDPLADFAFVSQLTSGQFLLARHPSVPAASVQALIALAKARPDRLTYGSSGAGGINHLAGELFRSMAGMQWVHVPFKGAGPATVALMGGEVDYIFSSTTALLGPVQAGRIRAVAVTGSKRFQSLPDVPTIAEAGLPGYEVSGWYGFYAPARTPAEIIRRLQAEAARALSLTDVKDKLAVAGNEPIGSSPEAFAAFVRTEIAKWTKVVKETGMRID